MLIMQDNEEELFEADVGAEKAAPAAAKAEGAEPAQGLEQGTCAGGHVRFE